MLILVLTACQTNPDQTSKNSIPYPLEEWKGVQGKTLADSKPDFIGQKKAGKDAPNVVVIMLDDAARDSNYYLKFARKFASQKENRWSI